MVSGSHEWSRLDLDGHVIHYKGRYLPDWTFAQAYVVLTGSTEKRIAFGPYADKSLDEMVAIARRISNERLSN